MSSLASPSLSQASVLIFLKVLVIMQGLFVLKMKPTTGTNLTALQSQNLTQTMCTNRSQFLGDIHNPWVRVGTLVFPVEMGVMQFSSPSNQLACLEMPLVGGRYTHQPRKLVQHISEVLPVWDRFSEMYKGLLGGLLLHESCFPQQKLNFWHPNSSRDPLPSLFSSFPQKSLAFHLHLAQLRSDDLVTREICI